MAYLTAVLTDLLHSQRDPLALCLLLQAYDTSAPPVPPGCHQLSWFRRYYRLWIPEPALEALVSALLPRQAFPGEPQLASCGHGWVLCRVMFPYLLSLRLRKLKGCVSLWLLTPARGGSPFPSPL